MLLKNLIKKTSIVLLSSCFIFLITGCGDIGSSKDTKPKDFIKNADGKYTGEDGFKKYKPDKRWDNYDKARCIQVLDVFFYEGEKVEDIMSEFENSEYIWNIKYNPEADVSSNKSLAIGIDGTDWLNLTINNYTELDICFQKDATLTNIEILQTKIAYDNIRYMKDFYYGEYTKFTQADLEKLANIMFYNSDVAYFRKAQTDDDAEYTYIVRYPIECRSGKHSEALSDDGERELGKEETFTFTYNFENKTVVFKNQTFLGAYEDYLAKNYYDKTFDTPANFMKIHKCEDYTKLNSEKYTDKEKNKHTAGTCDVCGKYYTFTNGVKDETIYKFPNKNRKK